MHVGTSERFVRHLFIAHIRSMVLITLAVPSRRLSLSCVFMYLCMICCFVVWFGIIWSVLELPNANLPVDLVSTLAIGAYLHFSRHRRMPGTYTVQ